jgi:hypothetical protein
MEKLELENKLIELWGSTVKPFNPALTSRLYENIDLDNLTNENLIYLVDILMKSSSSSMYGFSVDRDNYDILYTVGVKLKAINSISRKLDPILRCYDILIGDASKNVGMFALATMYLVADLERYLKSNSIYLNGEGIIIKEIPKTLRATISSHQFKIGKRINQIGDVIKIYCYRNNSSFAIYLKNIDAETKKYNKIKLKDCYNIINGKRIKPKLNHLNLIERVNVTRNLLMHGEKSYLTTEMFFFLSLNAIIFLYDQNVYSEY